MTTSYIPLLQLNIYINSDFQSKNIIGNLYIDIHEDKTRITFEVYYRGDNKKLSAASYSYQFRISKWNKKLSHEEKNKILKDVTIERRHKFLAFLRFISILDNIEIPKITTKKELDQVSKKFQNLIKGYIEKKEIDFIKIL